MLMYILKAFHFFNLKNEIIFDFQIQLQQYRGKDVFKDIVPLCESSWTVIQQVRSSPVNVYIESNLYYPFPVRLKKF